MGALFVGSLTTYSHTYSGSTKTLAAYYERRYSSPIAAKRSDRVSGSAVTTEFLEAEHTDLNKQPTQVPGEPACSGCESGDLA